MSKRPSKALRGEAFAEDSKARKGTDEKNQASIAYATYARNTIAATVRPAHRKRFGLASAKHSRSEPTDRGATNAMVFGVHCSTSSGIPNAKPRRGRASAQKRNRLPPKTVVPNAIPSPPNGLPLTRAVLHTAGATPEHDTPDGSERHGARVQRPCWASLWLER